MTRMPRSQFFFRRHSTFAALLIVLVILSLTCCGNYLLFHTLAEMFSIIIAFAMFLFAWNTRRFAENGYIMVLGIGFLYVGSLDLLHTLAYKGLHIFQNADANMATELWIAGRYTQAFTFLAASFFLQRKMHLHWFFIGYTLFAGFLLAAIFTFEIFPNCFVEGTGQTTFKIVSEFIVCLLLAVSAVFMARRRRHLDPKMFRYLMACILLTIAAEIIFTFYKDVYGTANIAGHLLKIIAFYMAYLAVIVTGLQNPVSTLFKELKAYSGRLEDLVDERTSELAKTNRKLQSQVMERRMAEMSLRSSERELRILSKRLMSAEENERQRIAGELHDSIGQALSAIKFSIENAIEKLADQGVGQHIELLRSIVPLIQKSIEEVRRIVMDLRPSILDDLGILATIDWFCREYGKVYAGIRIEKDVQIAESEIEPEWKTVLYRILQETLNNVAKHSGSDRVHLGLKRIGIFYELRIEDNGKGFELDKTEREDHLQPGFGLTSMRERAETMGATFLVSTETGRGTIVCVRWPVAEPGAIGKTFET